MAKQHDRPPSGANDTVTFTLRVSARTRAMLDALAKEGLYSNTRNGVADELLREKLREIAGSRFPPDLLAKTDTILKKSAGKRRPRKQ